MYEKILVGVGYLNSRFETGIHTPLEDAILAHEFVDTSAWSKLDEVPFDFERRRLSVLLGHSGKHFLIVKGAPEAVLMHCDRYEDSDSKVAAWSRSDHVETRLVHAGHRVPT